MDGAGSTGALNHRRVQMTEEEEPKEASPSASGSRIGGPAERMRRMREILGMAGMPELPMREARHRYITSHPFVRDYPAFAAHVLERGQAFDTILFLERDALPIQRCCQRLAEAWALDVDLQGLPFTRAMLPLRYHQGLERLDQRGHAGSFEHRLTLVRRTARKAVPGELLHRYLSESLEGMGQRILAVDTGFWGTMCLYLKTLFPKRVADYLLAAGPEGSRAWRTDSSEHGVSQQIENAFNYPYEYQDLAENSDGRLRARRDTWLAYNQEKFDAELAALDELVACYLDSHPAPPWRP
jgi:hypothetical protein